MQKDYYDILGIPPNASKEEIKRAFSILAHQYHPDKNNGNEKRFKEITEAYRVLSDSKSRSDYDRTYKPRSSNYEYKESKDSNTEQKKKNGDMGSKKEEFILFGMPIKKTFLINIVFGSFFFISIIATGVSIADSIGTNQSKAVAVPSALNNNIVWKDVSLGSNGLKQDGFGFSVAGTNFGETFSQSSWGIWNRKTEGAFLVVRLKTNNIDTKASSVRLSTFKIVDQAGREYFPSNLLKCNGEVVNSFSIGEQYLYLKPDIPCTMSLLFEVSKNTTNWYFNFKYKL